MVTGSCSNLGRHQPNINPNRLPFSEKEANYSPIICLLHVSSLFLTYSS